MYAEGNRTAVSVQEVFFNLHGGSAISFFLPVLPGPSAAPGRELHGHLGLRAAPGVRPSCIAAIGSSYS